MTKTNLNAHKLFADSPKGNDYLTRLNVDDEDEEMLRLAREEIRSAIRQGFAAWQPIVEKRVLFDEAVARKADALPALRPKFRMQGSAVYHTLNDPAQKPPQQIDYDDGVFLPVSFVAATGNPLVAASGYFTLVEKILAPLCDKHGWVLNPKLKDSCVGVQIGRHAHIDLPLYAIADDEFQELVEKMAKSAVAEGSSSELRDSVELEEALYANIEQGKIQLAHRKKGWVRSDPRAIENWFRDAIESHGAQIRRISRYLKGWRDFNWGRYSLSSITLMKCVVDVFDEARGTFDDKRDDHAILEVARKLPAKFGGLIKNPVLDQWLNDDWTSDERADYVTGAKKLVGHLHRALFEHRAALDAVTEVTSAFGPRIPQDLSLIEVSSVFPEVMRYERERVPAPAVPKTKSG